LFALSLTAVTHYNHSTIIENVSVATDEFPLNLSVPSSLFSSQETFFV